MIHGSDSVHSYAMKVENTRNFVVTQKAPKPGAISATQSSKWIICTLTTWQTTPLYPANLVTQPHQKYNIKVHYVLFSRQENLGKTKELLDKNFSLQCLWKPKSKTKSNAYQNLILFSSFLFSMLLNQEHFTRFPSLSQ